MNEFCQHYPSGKLLSQIYFENGLKQGAAKTFSESGQLLSHRNFDKGLEEGIHRYFYPSGQLKTEISYSHGVLDGEVILYYPNGNLKRSCSFRRGKREGKDTLYSVKSFPLLQAEYQEDKPIGKATTWHFEGPISKEVTYFTPGVIAEIKRWDLDGKLLPEAEKDYIDTAVLNSLKLQSSITGMTKGLERLMHTFEEDLSSQFQKEVNEEISSISHEMDHLKNLSDELLLTSGITGREKEAIWKTPSNELQLYAFLQGITSPMQESMLKLQWQLRGMIENLESNSNDTPKSE